MSSGVSLWTPALPITGVPDGRRALAPSYTTVLVSPRTLRQGTPLLLLVCAILAAGWFVHENLILPAGAFQYDEAAHALRGQLIAWDIQHGDWLAFLFDTYRQVYWPPLHAWLTGGLFLFRDATEANARTLSLFLWIGLALTLYFAGRRLSAPGGTATGVVAALLALTSPLLLKYAAMCMLEIPGLLAVSLSLWAYFRTLDDDTPGANVLLAAALLATFFTKVNYGVLLCMAVAVMRLLDARFHPRRLITRSNFWLAAPMAIVFAIWFAYPAKILLTWQLLVHRPIGGLDPFSLEGLLFYPRALVELSGSPLLFAAYAASLAAALRRWRNRKLRLLVLVFAIQFLIGELHHTKDIRHLLPVLPALLLLTDHYCGVWWERARAASHGTVVWAPRLVTALLLIIATTLPAKVQPENRAAGKLVSEYLSSLAANPGPALVVGAKEVESLPLPLIDYVLIREGRLDPPQAGAIMQPREERKLASLAQRLPGWLAGLVMPVFTRSEKPEKTRTIFVGLPPEFDRQRFAEFFPSTFERGNFARVVEVSSLAEAPIFPLPNQREAPLELISTREFPDEAVRVNLYRPGSSAP